MTVVDFTWREQQHSSRNTELGFDSADATLERAVPSCSLRRESEYSSYRSSRSLPPWRSSRASVIHWTSLPSESFGIIHWLEDFSFSQYTLPTKFLLVSYFMKLWKQYLGLWWSYWVNTLFSSHSSNIYWNTDYIWNTIICNSGLRTYTFVSQKVYELRDIYNALYSSTFNLS